MSDVSQRFWAKVEKSETCWLWTAYIDGNGYGRFRGNRQGMSPAHRWAYTDAVGAIPSGLQLDHLCRVRHCVNPDHLEPVTPAENQRRGLINQNATKANCGLCGRPYGYMYVGNTGKVWRRCRPCFNYAKRVARALQGTRMPSRSRVNGQRANVRKSRTPR